MPEYSQNKFPLSLSTTLGANKLLLRRFSGEEALSELFHFQLEMECHDNNLDLSSLVGSAFAVTLTLHSGVKRIVHGLATRISTHGSAPRFTTYRAELRPWFWMLTLASDCKIFQNMSVPEIIEDVFGALGFKDYRNSLTGTYEKRDYCVQYNESAFNFVSRLMEDEGMFYYFEHTAQKHTLVMADDLGSVAAVPGAEKLTTGIERSGTISMNDLILDRVTFEQAVVPGSFGMGDYAFKTPAVKLDVSVESANPERALYVYPGEFLTTGVGERRARLRLESVEVPAKTLRGEGHCRAFLPGYKFTLEGQQRVTLNQSYVLRRVVHDGTQSGYRNSFEAIPSGLPFRPPLISPKPKVFGCQTAVVTGKQGEEIWTDEYGRVKVQFHWDRKGKKDEKSSCWIRVDQGWAGKKWGSLFLPRVGQEVLVTFVDGNPDLPIVTGALYNADQEVPYSLPTDQTKSTLLSRSSKYGAAGNELRFEDKKDSEEVFLHAQKDFNIVVENARTTTVKEADDTLTVEKGKRAVDVQKGDETHNNGANFTHDVTGNYSLTVKGNLTIDISGSITIKAGTTLAMEAGSSLSSKAGTSHASQGGVSLSTKAPSISQTADASQTVDGGGMLVLKGGVVKIN